MAAMNAKHIDQDHVGDAPAGEYPPRFVPPSRVGGAGEDLFGISHATGRPNVDVLSEEEDDRSSRGGDAESHFQWRERSAAAQVLEAFGLNRGQPQEGRRSTVRVR